MRLATFSRTFGFCVFHARIIPIAIRWIWRKFFGSSFQYKLYLIEYKREQSEPKAIFEITSFMKHSLFLSLSQSIPTSFVFMFVCVNLAYWIDVKFDWITKFEIDAGFDNYFGIAYIPHTLFSSIFRSPFCKWFFCSDRIIDNALNAKFNF